MLRTLIRSKRGELGGPTRITLKKILPALIMMVLFLLVGFALLRSRGYLDFETLTGTFSKTVESGMDIGGM
ncbi:MAG: hypothetical protein QF415_06895 [Candidatus Undinarchaeales archaeon]|jgi:hypothetical protein|nr:hypothetical protein [Methanopyri archaeon]MDP7079599.1 hypothetical protein [Candidatus Undinarchaeales archaeon]MDP7491716.1 hypothetical protein [Candidatus Undinarchaeales archaeon]|tara:strand:- start:156 stop:368 length:213 start_codon:yes stop_codon:yes gene_type:complete